MLRALPFASLTLLVLALAGCDCAGEGMGEGCENNADCPSGQVCVDRACVPGVDASTEMDAGPPARG